MRWRKKRGTLVHLSGYLGRRRKRIARRGNLRGRNENHLPSKHK